MWSFFGNSPILWALYTLCFFSLVIIIEKIWMFLQIDTEKKAFHLLNDVKETLKQPISQKKIDHARTLCLSADQKNIVAAIIRHILEKHKQKTKWLLDLAEREREMRLPYLQKRISLLGTFAAIAPLLGLLGTVLGIITAFHANTASSEKMQTLLLSQGIAHALTTTTLGLFIAIPSLFFHNLFVSKVEKIDNNLSLLARELISHIKMEKK